MARTQTMVQLSDDLIDQLDSHAARRGVSRSALIRTAIEKLLAEDEEAVLGRSIVEGYRRIPQGTPDEWGDLSIWGDIATRETLQRLDAEEQAAGAVR